VIDDPGERLRVAVGQLCACYRQAAPALGNILCDETGRPVLSDRLTGYRRYLTTRPGTRSSPAAVCAAACSSRRASRPATPPAGYPDYYAKMTAYANMISGRAQAIDPNATARLLVPVKMTESEPVFRYLDTASTRAQISLITGKLALLKVAIVGVGGTGAYVLDLIAKTPVSEIHLFDGDTFYAHNAFRAPGAASVEDLDAMPSKAEYHRDRYAAMRRGIIAHPYHIDESNIGELQDTTFVFLTMDPGPGKKLIVESSRNSRSRSSTPGWASSALATNCAGS
jgi:hypothetical protein